MWLPMPNQVLQLFINKKIKIEIRFGTPPYSWHHHYLKPCIDGARATLYSYRIIVLDQKSFSGQVRKKKKKKIRQKSTAYIIIFQLTKLEQCRFSYSRSLQRFCLSHFSFLISNIKEECVLQANSPSLMASCSSSEMLKKIIEMFCGKTKKKNIHNHKVGERKKVKGTVVLMKKNVLDFKDIKASFIDRIHELLGKGVSMQLISSVHPDPGYRLSLFL